MNLHMIAATLALAILALLAGPATRSLAAEPAVAGSTGSDTPAGLFFRTTEAGSVLEAPLVGSDVSMEVNGMVARVTVRQVFHNPTERWLEGIYVFPLPERSAVDRLTMVIGDREVKGRIMEKAEAERAYREAAANGQHASLVSGKRPNVFVTAVANIGPGEDVTVQIGYQDAVAYENGTFSLRFPMVVAPRYTPKPENQEAPVAEAPATQQPVAAGTASDGPARDLFGPVHTDGGKHNPLSLTVHLDAGVPLADLRSLYHQVVIESDSDGSQTIRLRDGVVPADRDFVLEWTPVASQTPQTAVFGEEVDGNAHLLVMMVPPRAQPAAAPLVTPRATPMPRQLVFVVDTSGSMFGDSLDQAKQAVVEALKRLQPDDSFNVIQFNSQTHALFEHPVPATTENVAKAWRYVSELQAEGGTEMRPALEQALTGSAPDGVLQQVVFLTDGAVGNEAELFRQVSARLGKHRLFTVGLGSAPNSYFMRKAAELGRGSFTHIGKLDEVKPRMDALLAKLEQPVLTDIKVGWPLTAGKRIESYPMPLPDLYAGEPVMFAARLEGVTLDQLDGKLLITGTGPDGAWQQRVPLTGLKPAPGTATIWARAKLAQIEDGLYRNDGQQVDRTAIRAQALDVALNYQLVTRYTSLVAIDEAVDRPQGQDLNTAEVPRNLPAGWNAQKVFGDTALKRAPTGMRERSLPAPLLQQAKANGRAVSLPQTATPAGRMAIVGGAYLFLALMLIVLVLRRTRRG